MEIVVISLGGSLIIPERMNFKFLDEFKRRLGKHYKDYKFVVVCGGGAIARKYIEALRKEGKSKKELSAAGIRATRMNALFMMQFFGKEANETLPMDMHEVKNLIEKHEVVFCGALRFSADSTSDGTAAKLAHFLKADFINITNVKGLYSSDPKNHKDAKFIPQINWRNFEKMALKIKFHAGQHFVLDQQAARMIKEHRIRTFIVSPDSRNLSNLLEGKKFIGTRIEN